MSDEWVADNEMKVACPRCGAGVGEPCVAASGASAPPHAGRRERAREVPIRTKTGKVLTDADIEALADEAERGYDISQIKPYRLTEYAKPPKKGKKKVKKKAKK